MNENISWRIAADGGNNTGENVLAATTSYKVLQHPPLRPAADCNLLARRSAAKAGYPKPACPVET